MLIGDKQNSVQPLKTDVIENMKGRTVVRRAPVKNADTLSNQYEGEAAVKRFTSSVKLTELPGTKELKIDDGRPADESTTEEKRCRRSVVSSWYITLRTLNIKEQLLIKSLTDSNSRIGLWRNVWTARYCELFKIEFL